MGLLANVFGPKPMAAAPGPLDDFWYQPLGYVATSGVRVDADSAMKLSTVYACVDLIASLVGVFPQHLYERLPDGGKRRATDQPLYALLHDRPNARHTPLEFRSLLQAHVLLRGNGYALIQEGPGGFADQLVPLLPDRMDVVTASDTPGETRLLYTYQPQSGPKLALQQDEVFHLRGLSFDGVKGMSVIAHAKETIGLGLAETEYGARFFGQSGIPPAVLKHPGKITRDGAKRLRQEWQDLHAGLKNAHQVAILEEGMDIKDIGIKPEDAQLLNSKSFTVEDVSRFFRVPLHLLSHTERQTSWGTGIEQQGLAFLSYTMLRWLVMWNSTVKRDLILAPERYYADFVTDALLKGDIKTRYQAYAIGRQWGWLSVNDVRAKEDEDPIGPAGDNYLEPLNMSPVGAPGGVDQVEVPEDSEEDTDPGDPSTAQAPERLLLEAMARDAAARIVRKEIVAMSKLAKRAGQDAAAWEAGVADFYALHQAHVQETLHLSEHQASLYVDEQAADLIKYGSPVMNLWETRRVEDLVALALAGKELPL